MVITCVDARRALSKSTHECFTGCIMYISLLKKVHIARKSAWTHLFQRMLPKLELYL